MPLLDEHKLNRRNTSLYLWTLYNLTDWYDYWTGGGVA
jgi:asparagine synthase (glutamine-hydrolysing)